MSRAVPASPSLYDEVGGMSYFEALVDSFYAGVADDEVLRPLYPESDLTGARRRLGLFLAQYWGGPSTYALERGHPRLRARHFPFWIGPTARERWLQHMRRAVEESDAPASARERLLEYFRGAAVALQNQGEDGAWALEARAPDAEVSDERSG
jgi:hemoglobin